jgi:hypothetical protein
MNDFLRLLGAALGGASTLAVIGAEEYGRLIKRAIVPSLVVLVSGFLLVLLSEVTDVAFLNMLAFLLIGGVLVLWFLLTIPVFWAVEIARSIQWQPVQRLLARFSALFLLIVVFAIISIRLPAGFDGMAWAGIFLTLIIGLSFFGFHLSRGFLALQLIGASLYAAVALLVPPEILAGLSDNYEVRTGRIGQNLSGRPNELDISLAVLTGSDPSAPLLFDPKGREPRWWCRDAQEKVSGMRCYDRAGRDPYNNAVLIPISPDFVDAALSRLRMQENIEQAAAAERQSAIEREREARSLVQREAAEAAERRQREETEAAERSRREASEERQLEELRQYQAANLIKGSGMVALALSIKSGGRFESTLEQELRQSIVGLSPGVFRTPSLSNGIYNRVIGGDSGEIEKLGLSDVAEVLVLGDLSTAFSPNAAIVGSGSLEYRLRLVAIETGSRNVKLDEVVVVDATGQSRKIAESRARSFLLERAGNLLQQRLGLE